MMKGRMNVDNKNNLRDLIIGNPRAKLRLAIKSAEKKIKEADRKQHHTTSGITLWRI